MDRSDFVGGCGVGGSTAVEVGCGAFVRLPEVSPRWSAWVQINTKEEKSKLQGMPEYPNPTRPRFSEVHASMYSVISVFLGIFSLRGIKSGAKRTNHI